MQYKVLNFLVDGLKLERQTQGLHQEGMLMSKELSKLASEDWEVEQTIITPLATIDSVIWTFLLTKD